MLIRVLAAVLLVLTPYAAFAALDEGPVPENWKLEIYGKGTSSPQGDSIHIATAGGSGGLYLRVALDKGQRYRLVVRGKPLQSVANLRVKLDDGTPRWFAAPDGRFETAVVGASQLEALIYSDSPFAYRLDTIDVERCETCRSESERLAELKAPFPGWSLQLYGRPELKAGEGVTITGNGEPAGLIFETTALKRYHLYRIRLTRGSGTDNVIARFDVPNRKPKWVHLREPVVVHDVFGTSAIKMWIYADTAFTYQLRKIGLEDCGYWYCSGDLGELTQLVRDQMGAGLAGWLTIVSYGIAMILLVACLVLAPRAVR